MPSLSSRLSVLLGGTPLVTVNAGYDISTTSAGLRCEHSHFKLNVMTLYSWVRRPPAH
ncbi:hypothetical protein M378DRAFT_161491 [Amanita muscaria Koide BX008]|uniref:Uncharacterized protein n=1 Tax=Amanita muscaria (strain Koide BX008) TaxID=946122 RepID=A0A0C2SRC7_AMAMK|nr:hypothetical protein M378DRAFT_161491 [Amanita muscaria Koide BX008]